MGKSTISVAIFNSYVTNYQRVIRSHPYFFSFKKKENSFAWRILHIKAQHCVTAMFDRSDVWCILVATLVLNPAHKPPFSSTVKIHRTGLFLS